MVVSHMPSSEYNVDNERAMQLKSAEQSINSNSIVPPTPVLQHIGIVGLGLIGGSLAMRLANAGCRVTAWNHTPRPYESARSYGITCVPTLEDVAVAEPDVLVLCNPLKTMPSILARLSSVIAPTTTLTDVGSVKSMVRDQVVDAGLGANYVGAHPMAGNERSGWEAADPALYDGALWAVTVDDTTDFARFRAVTDMIVETCRNRIIVIDDATHDRAAAMISHMPHVVATALANELVDHNDRDIAVALAAGSWRDMTRVALTDPDRTRAMVEEDAENVELLLRRMAVRLDNIATALHDWRTLNNNDQERRTAHNAIAHFFEQAQPFRDYKAQTDTAQKQESVGDGAISRHCGRGTTQEQGSIPEFSNDIHLTLGNNWQQTLYESACRGEHIIRFDSERTAVARVLSHLPHRQ